MKEKKIESVVFISNFFNHHQKPVSDSFFAEFGEGYKFLETEEMTKERKNLGWGMDVYPSYVISSQQFQSEFNECLEIINSADVVIVGSAPEYLISARKKKKKIIFRYSERPLKRGLELWKFIPRLIKWKQKNLPSKQIYMLCASAYTYADYAKFGLFKNRCYKWGYFPAAKKYDNVEGLLKSKKSHSIIWVARFIDWKHPETAIEVAKRLKKDGYDFELTIIGTGPLEQSLKNIILDAGLERLVKMLGSMTPEQVRMHMEQSEIYLFTSDRNEGWGAVLNEAMNSACAVVASHAIGSVPFLIKDEDNGLIYQDGNIDDLYLKVKFLFDNQEKRKKMGLQAYQTIIEEWNAENATKKFISLAENLLNEGRTTDLSEDGVCSKANILKDNWYVGALNIVE